MPEHHRTNVNLLERAWKNAIKMMRGLENQHQVSNKERMTKLMLLNLKNARHRRSIIKAFRYIKA